MNKEVLKKITKDIKKDLPSLNTFNINKLPKALLIGYLLKYRTSQEGIDNLYASAEYLADNGYYKE